MLITFPDQTLYTIAAPWVYVTTIVQGLAAYAMIAGVMQTGAMEFAGLAQLSSYYEDSKPAQMVTDGLYAIVRHPLYSAGLVFIWLSSEMTINRVALWIVFSLYILVGAYFEERKLLKDIGPAYAEYKKRTPMLIPGLIKKE
jgi:protein-S-isoprenylcysteine O-methyltransferase Ste14